MNYPDFTAKFGTATRVRGLPRGEGDDLRSLLAGGESELYEWFNLTANPKAVKSLAGCIRFRDGGVSATVAAMFDRAQKSPLLDFLSARCETRTAPPRSSARDVVHGHSSGDETREAAIGFSMPSRKEWRGRSLPHDIVKELGDKYKLAIADGLIGKIHAVTVAMPAKQELPKGGKPGPMLVLHTNDADSAAAWEDFVPKLLATSVEPRLRPSHLRNRSTA